MTFPTDPKNPWTTQSVKTVMDTPWLRVERHDCIAPDGLPRDYGIVRFKNRAVGVIPWENGGVWMVGQTRYALDRYSWEIPEGGVPQGEDMLDAAKRELKEETGISAARFERLFECHLSNSVTDEWGEVYLATGLTHGDAAPEGSEDITRLWVPLPDLLAAIKAGRVTDALTIMAAYRLRIMELEGALP